MMKYLKKLKNEKGFTLIEMLIVIMIVSMLLLLVMTNIDGVEKGIKKTTNTGVVQTIESQKVIYKIEKNKEATIENLLADKYITAEQKAAYDAATKKD